MGRRRGQTGCAGSMTRRGDGILVGAPGLWQFEAVKKTLHRCFVVLGLLAMVSALAAIPAGMALASSKAEMAALADSADDMPCDHPCPGCAKPCPDMGHCLLKCFRQLSSAPAQAGVQGHYVRDLIPAGLSRRVSEAPIPPLLRPPSVRESRRKATSVPAPRRGPLRVGRLADGGFTTTGHIAMIKKYAGVRWRGCLPPEQDKRRRAAPTASMRAISSSEARPA